MAEEFLVRPMSLVIAASGAICLAASLMLAQRNGSTSLVLRISPEEEVTPAQLAVEFRVTDAAVSSQTAKVAARVRARPGERIRLVAMAGALDGPQGQLPWSAIRWNGAVEQATGGGRDATCTSGRFESPRASDLAADWNSSGSLTCAVVFSLADPHDLPPGTYSGVVSFGVRTE